MNKFNKEELIGYIKRSIPDIARKCNIKDTDVINCMKEIINKVK